MALERRQDILPKVNHTESLLVHFGFSLPDIYWDLEENRYGNMNRTFINRAIHLMVTEAEQLRCRRKVRVYGLKENFDENVTALIIDTFYTVMKVHSRPEDYSQVYRTEYTGGGHRPIIVVFKDEHLLNPIFENKHRMVRKRMRINQQLCEERHKVLLKARAIFGRRKVVFCNGKIQVKTPDGYTRTVGTLWQLGDLCNEVRAYPNKNPPSHLLT